MGKNYFSLDTCYRFEFHLKKKKEGVNLKKERVRYEKQEGNKLEVRDERHFKEKKVIKI